MSFMHPIKMVSATGALLAGLGLSGDVPAQSAAACGSGPKLAADLWQAYERQTKEAGCYLPWKAGSPDSWGPCMQEYSKIPLQLGEKMIGVWNHLADNEWATIGPRRIEPGSNHGTLLSPGNRLWLTHTPQFMDEVRVRIHKRKATDAKLLGAEIPLNTRVDVSVCATRPDGESKLIHRERVLAKDDAGKVVDLSMTEDPEPAILSVFMRSTAKVPLTFKYDIRVDVEPKKFHAGPVDGFADVHMHQMADVAYAGLWYWGNHAVPADQLEDEVVVSEPADALTELVETARPQLAETMPEQFYAHAVPNIFSEDDHMTILHGAPAPDSLESWPRFDDIAHQQVNASWLKRAHDNGLDLAVVSAVNFQAACFAMRALLPDQNSARRCADMLNVKRQLEAAQAMAERYDWYEIAVHPWHARKIIDEGKLAVVLSMEVSNLMPIAQGSFKAELEELRAMGLRTMQLAHETNSRYAGAATHRKIFRLFEKLKHPFQSKKGFETDARGRNLRGLTDEGEELVEHLMDRHMPIDIAHLSIRSVNGLHDMAMARGGYPLYDSHTRLNAVLPHGAKEEQGEFLTTCRQAQYIEETGGLVGLRTGDTDLLTHQDEHGPVIRNDCPGSSRSFAQLVQFTADQTGLDMAFGTDLNGFITQVGPRFGPRACHRPGDDDRVGYAQQQRDKGEASERFHRLGLSHVGYLPELLTELDSLGVDVRRLEDSAENFLRMWERAWNEERSPQTVTTRCPGWSDARIALRERRHRPEPDHSINGSVSVRVDPVRGGPETIDSFDSGEITAGTFLQQVALDPSVTAGQPEFRLNRAGFDDDGLLAATGETLAFSAGEPITQSGRYALETVLLDDDDKTHFGQLFFQVAEDPDDIRSAVDYVLRGAEDVVSYNWNRDRQRFVFTHSRGTQGTGTGQSWTFSGSLTPEVSSDDDYAVQDFLIRIDGEAVDNRTAFNRPGEYTLEVYACYNILAGDCDTIEGAGADSRSKERKRRHRKHEKSPPPKDASSESSQPGPLPPGTLLIARHEVVIQEPDLLLDVSGADRIRPTRDIDSTIADEPVLNTLSGQAAKLDEAAHSWIGDYGGRSDGRRARLLIEAAEGNEALVLRFEDLDRNTQLSARVPASRANAQPAHVLEDIVLEGGGNRKRLGRLILHNGGQHISGHSLWRETPYAVAFSKSGFDASAGSGDRLDRSDWARAWAGRYEGFGDGRRVELEIAAAENTLDVTWRDRDRNVTFTGRVPMESQQASPAHVLSDLELTSAEGATKAVGRLYLHTWDDHYISGNTLWRDTPYGAQFYRVGD